VSYRAGEFIIKDLGSKNGTYVNGERLPREREIIVPVGSEIEVTKNIVFELWDRDTILDVDREVVTSEQEVSTHGESELIFQPMPGIAYADDRDGEINDDYSPI
jgi:pSer/pThr/pTyr-binding forkhead associated (FHA) protein